MNQRQTNSSYPLVSVVVPCYNQAEYLDDALASVLKQDYQNWECLIVNDGSTDNTEEIAKVWTQKDTRFIYLKKDNGGLSNARNHGILNTKGLYILPLDSDDKISNNYIKECVDKLESNPKIKLVYGKVEQFGTRTGIWELGEYSYLDLLAYNMIHCCAMYRKALWVNVGGYDETMKKGLEDWEFWIRILNDGGYVQLLKKSTFYYRIKDVSMITLMDKTAFRDTRAYVLRKHADIYMQKLYEMVQYNRRLKSQYYSDFIGINGLLKGLFRRN